MLKNFPDHIGRYEIKKLVGQGSVANVYQAFDPKLNRDVALKVLKRRHSGDTDFGKRFVQGALASGKVSAHPHIVTIFDIDECDGFSFIAMEFVGRESLEQRKHRNVRFTEQDVIQIGIQVALALAHAHAHEVVHRDIKPSNILCVDDTNTVLLTDFDVAKLKTDLSSVETVVGEVLGTPQYMSPEQFNSGQVDGRSDIFSLGIVLYELLANRKPFGGDTFIQVAVEVCKEEPKPIEDVVPGISPAMIAVIQRCLQKNPHKRFQSAEALMHALEKIALGTSGEIVTGNSESWSFWVPESVMRFSIWGIAIAFPLLLLCLWFAHTYESTLAERQAVDTGRATVSWIDDLFWIYVERGDSDIFETKEVQALARVINLMKPFEFLTITDSKNIVRVSSDEQNLGMPYVQPANTKVLSPLDDQDQVRVYAEDVEGGERYTIVRDVQFVGTNGSKNVATVYLGVRPQKEFARVALLLSGLSGALSLLIALGAALIWTIRTQNQGTFSKVFRFKPFLAHGKSPLQQESHVESEEQEPEEQDLEKQAVSFPPREGEAKAPNEPIDEGLRLKPKRSQETEHVE